MREVIVPDGWITTELVSIGEIVTGKTPSKKEPENFGGNVPFIKPGDLNAGGYITHTVETLTSKGSDAVPSVPENSLPVTCIGNLGKVGITKCRSVTNQQINTVIPYNGIEYKYLYHYLRTIKQWMEREASATTVTIINKGKFSKAPVLLAPHFEQKEIAARLDNLLAQVDSIKTRLDSIPTILKRFRQSVLAAAVSGRLVNGGSKLDSAPFSDLIDEMKNGLSPKPNEEGRGYPILRISSVRSLVVDQEGVRYLECDEKTRNVYTLEEDDLLFTRYNGSLDFVGVCGRYQKKKHDILLYPDKLIRVRTKHELLLPKYAEMFFSAPQTRKVVTDFIKSTSGQKGISGKDLKSVLVNFPLVEQQTEILRCVEQLFTFADQIEQRVKDAQFRVNNLTQSILAKAFRGELTADWRAQNPDLISGENAAEALLEKIKSEREVIESTKKVVKRKKAKV